MKEAIERVDSGIVFTFIGSDAEGKRQIEAGMSTLRGAGGGDGQHNLPGEGEKSHRLAEAFAEYSRDIPPAIDLSRPMD